MVLMWCLSGIVMMYFPYPILSDTERLSGSSVLELELCCDSRKLRPLDAVIAVESFVVAMLSDAPVLRARLTSGEVVLFSLLDGHEKRLLERSELLQAGQRFGQNMKLTRQDPAAYEIENIFLDQWTIQSEYAMHRPMVRFSDADGTHWYVSSRTGEVVQLTHRAERIGSWFGSVVHWLYPTVIRQHPLLWSQLVIWSTIAALFLIGAGMMLGIRNYRFGKSNETIDKATHERRSPYRGWKMWHHYAGLATGVLLMGWLLSGFISMNPWGALESRSFATDRMRYMGNAVTLSRVYRFLNDTTVLPSDTVRIESAVVNGNIEAVAFNRQGAVTRFTANQLMGSATSLDIKGHAQRMRPNAVIAALDELHEGDDYYYEHHDEKVFPVFRVTYDDGERLYFAQATGRLELAVDKNHAWYRWLFRALHTGDFHPIARTRPLWDGWMLLLLLPMLAGATTGVVLAYRHLARYESHRDAN